MVLLWKLFVYFNVALIRNIIAIQITITVQYDTVVASTTMVPIKIMPTFKEIWYPYWTISRKYHNSPSIHKIVKLYSIVLYNVMCGSEKGGGFLTTLENSNFQKYALDPPPPLLGKHIHPSPWKKLFWIRACSTSQYILLLY